MCVVGSSPTVLYLMVLAMPMISRAGGRLKMCRWRPIGSSLGKNCFAIASLMMITGVEPCRSFGVNARPRRIGMPSVSK